MLEYTARTLWMCLSGNPLYHDISAHVLNYACNYLRRELALHKGLITYLSRIICMLVENSTRNKATDNDPLRVGCSIRPDVPFCQEERNPTLPWATFSGWLSATFLLTELFIKPVTPVYGAVVDLYRRPLRYPMRVVRCLPCLESG